MTEPLQILKIGGKLIEEDSLLWEVLKVFSNIPGRKVLVHGGGKEAGQLSEKLGLSVRMVDGRRVTDAETLKVATMVYGGLFNKRIVSLLQSMGCNALGLSGADGNSILAHKRKVAEVDFGLVGDVEQVNGSFLTGLLKMGLTPVFCALTHDGAGQMLNTNADTIATELAIALANTYAVKLIYCFDKPGVLLNADDDGSLIDTLDRERYARLRERRAIHTGMLPKLENAFRALDHGAEEVLIVGLGYLTGSVGGTRIL